MSTHFARADFTDYVLSQVATCGKPVGDSERPRGGAAGWQGEPDADGTNFIPYVVVVPLDISNMQADFQDDKRVVLIPYALTSYGVSRKQCEWMADSARKAVDDMIHTALDLVGGARSIQNVLHTKIGAVTRVGDDNPPYYGQTDVLTLWTSR